MGNTYRQKSDDCLAVNEKGFYCHKTHAKGVTALDYLIHIHGYHLVDAVCRIINEAPYQKGDTPGNQDRPPPPNANKNGPATITPTPQKTIPSVNATENILCREHKNLKLPRRNKNNCQVTTYLQKRGIERDLINDCISRGIIYESAPYGNAVFCGKDENGKTRFAAVRSIRGDFMYDAEGSDKKFAFQLAPENPDTNAVMLFESPIDCLSHHSLCKRGDIPVFDGWRLSLAGTSSAAINRFLAKHPEISLCIIGTDNDDAGNPAAARIASEVSVETKRMSPAGCKDWNDMLLSALQSQRGKTKIRGQEYHELPE